MPPLSKQGKHLRKAELARAAAKASHEENLLPYGRSQRRIHELTSKLADAEQRAMKAEDSSRHALRDKTNARHTSNRNKRLVEALRTETDGLRKQLDPTLHEKLAHAETEVQHTANIETFTTGKNDGFMPVPVTTLMP